MKDRTGPTFMEQVPDRCRCDVTCLAHGTCCPDFPLSQLMQGKIFRDVSEFAHEILANETLNNADMVLDYEDNAEALDECQDSGLHLLAQDVRTKHVLLPSYRMVSLCSVLNISVSLKQKCEARQTETHNSAIDDFLPVQSLVSGIVYRNKHCLFCSDESGSQYEDWDVYFVSPENMEFLLVTHYYSSDNAANLALSGSLNVDLIFEPDEALKQRFPPQACFNIDVDTCAADTVNDNALIDSACSSFVAPVFENRQGETFERSAMFKNIACYHCNGGSNIENRDSCIRRQTPFALQLNSKIAERQKEPISSNSRNHEAVEMFTSLKCGEGHVFDGIKVRRCLFIKEINSAY